MNFEDIYLCAKSSHSQQELEKKLKLLYGGLNSLRIEPPLDISAAGQLAYEGDDERVQWLVELGASKAYAAAGYARAGKHKKVHEYAKDLYESPTDNDKIKTKDLIAQAYVSAGFDIKNIPDPNVADNLKNLDPAALAIGYAAAGNDNKVQECYDALIVKYQNTRNTQAYNASTNTKYSLEEATNIANPIIAYAYALAGNIKKAEKFFPTPEKPITNNNLTDDAKNIASAYARAGNHRKVKELFDAYNLNMNEIYDIYNNVGNELRYNALYDFVINNTIKDREAFGNAIISPLTKIQLHLRKANDHKQELSNLIYKYLEDREQKADANDKTRQYLHGSFFPFQKSFLDKKLAVNALQRSLDGEHIDLLEHLSTLRNGKLGKELRTFIKSGKANDLVDGQKVHTVTEFITALHKKCNPSQNPSV